MTQNLDKEEDVILIIIEVLGALVKPENPKSKAVFGQEPNMIFYKSQVFHCYRFVTNDTDKFNQL